MKNKPIKLNVSTNEELKKTFIFELTDSEVELKFELSESDVNECLSKESLLKLTDQFPDYFVNETKELTKEEAIERHLVLTLTSIIDKALDSKANKKALKDVGAHAMEQMTSHVLNDSDVVKFFNICGLYNT